MLLILLDMILFLKLLVVFVVNLLFYLDQLLVTIQVILLFW